MTASLQDVPAGDRTYDGGVLPSRNKLPAFAGADGTYSQGSDNVADNANVTALVINPTSPTGVHAGAAVQLAAVGTYPNASTGDVTDLATWASASKAIATIDQTGLVTPLTAGTSTISAFLNGVTATKTFTVS